MARMVMLLGCLTCLIWAAGASSRTTAGWTTLAPGVREMRLSVSGEQSQIPGEMHCLELDLARARLGIVDARRYGRTRATAEKMRQLAGALAVANASFFDEDLKPMGLLVDGGEELNPVRRADWGVFYVDEKRRAHVVHTREWNRRRGAAVQMAVQAGPRLVVDGKPTQVKLSLARRTALCIPAGDGGAVDRTRARLVATKQPILLAEFARFLALPASQGGFGCAYALNLDGGSSTQLAVAGSDVGLGIRGADEVPIGIAVFAGGAPEKGVHGSSRKPAAVVR